MMPDNVTYLMTKMRVKEKVVLPGLGIWVNQKSIKSVRKGHFVEKQHQKLSFIGGVDQPSRI